jgi:hypothetical protein
VEVPAALPLGLGSQLGCRVESDDGVDAVPGDAELDGEADVLWAEQVDEGGDAVRCRGADAVFQAVAVGDDGRSLGLQPAGVPAGGDGDDAGAAQAQELDGDAADTAGGHPHGYRVAGPGADGTDGGPGGAARPQRAPATSHGSAGSLAVIWLAG